MRAPRRMGTMAVVLAGLPGAAAPAHAADARDSRLFVGLGLGTGPTSLRIDGRATSEGGWTANFGAELGVSQTLFDPEWGVIAVARASSWDTAWSSDRGESRWRVDLALGPELRLERPQRRGRIVWRFSAPLGITWAWIRPGDGRAVQDRYGGGHGVHAGITAGVDFSGPRHGGYVEIDYRVHWTGIEHTATLVAAPDTSVRQQYRFVDHAILFAAGYVFRLW